MDFMGIIKRKKNIRSYKPDPVPDEGLNQILEAVRFASSGVYHQPWNFEVVKKHETKMKLEISVCASEAPIVIVGCTDLEVFSFFHIVDLSIPFEHILLASANFGLGTCWIGNFLEFDETIKKVLNIPMHLKIIVVTPLGYPAEVPISKERKPFSAYIHSESF